MGDDGPFEGEDELPQLQNLINKISLCDAGEYISAGEQLEVCLGNVDRSDPNWRKAIHNQLLDEEEERNEVTIGQADEGAPRIDERSFDADDKYDPELKQPVIKTTSEAKKVAEQ